MSTPLRINDPRIMCSEFRRGTAPRRRNPDIGGRSLNKKTRALPARESLEDRMMLAGFLMFGIADTDSFGTLRDAIDQVNVSIDPSNTISFDIGKGIRTIGSGSALPEILNPEVILGTTRPGSKSTPPIRIDGENTRYGMSGLVLAVNSSGPVIQSLPIDDFGADEGINLESSTDQLIGNYLGTEVEGETGAELSTGSEFGGNGNSIGGTSPGDAIDFSGNTGLGIVIDGTSCSVGINLIGTDATSDSVPADVQGVGMHVHIPGATIGGTSYGAGNVISGNNLGVYAEQQPLVEGKLIGSDATGTAHLPNYEGLYVESNVAIGRMWIPFPELPTDS